MSASALTAYAAARELHETRANHLAMVEDDIAEFWATPRPSPLAVSSAEDQLRVRRITRLMAERSAVVVVERQAHEQLLRAIRTLVTGLPTGALQRRAAALLDGWPAAQAELEAIDAGGAAIDTAHRAMVAELCALLDPLVEQRTPFSA